MSLVTQEHHINGAAARNAGIRASKGDYIAFLDDDDFWDKNKLDIQVNVLNSLDDSWGGVSCKNKIFKGGKLCRLGLTYKSGHLFKRILLRQVEVSTITILLRSKCIPKGGLFDERLSRHQEVQALVNFTYNYKLKLIDEFLCNVDIDDALNRPDPEKLLQIKKVFLDSVKDITSKMSKFDNWNIKLMNRFEVGGLYIRRGNYLKGIKECSVVLLSPMALYYAISLVRKKRKRAKLAENFEHRDINYYLKQNGLSYI